MADSTQAVTTVIPDSDVSTPLAVYKVRVLGNSAAVRAWIGLATALLNNLIADERVTDVFSRWRKVLSSADVPRLVQAHNDDVVFRAFEAGGNEALSVRGS